MFKYRYPTVLKNKIVQIKGVSSGDSSKNSSVSKISGFNINFLMSGKCSGSFISDCVFGDVVMSDVMRCFENAFLYQSRTIRWHRIVQHSVVSSGDNPNITPVSKMDGIKTILLTPTKWPPSDHFPDVRKMVGVSAFVRQLLVFVRLTRQKYLIKAESLFNLAKETQSYQFVDVNKMIADISCDGVWC